MDTIDIGKMKNILVFASHTLVENEEYLCRLDSFVGDGDHGVTISKGFKSVIETLNSNKYDSIGMLYDAVGVSLMTNMGGAIGPIFGSIFTAAGKTCTHSSEVNVYGLYQMFNSSLQTIKRIGNVKEGDRTLVDSLSPVVEALKEAAENNLSIEESFILSEKHAKEGMENTKNMVAKKGRARFLGEKSLGYQDAGATSFYLIIKCFSDFLRGESL